jgi:nitroreductase
LDVEHPILELIRRRATVERFDPDRGLDEQAIRELVREATRAPSSFNIQHWRFVAVRRPEDKQRLFEAAYGQEQVRDAAVTFIILGDLRGVERLPGIMQTAVERGALPQGKASAWIDMANKIYADHGLARDEAIRSASLAAMTMMLVAQARGLASGALSGFDPQRLRREFDIDERHVPVMLLAVGHAVETAASRMPRLELSEVLAFDRWTESTSKN